MSSQTFKELPLWQHAMGMVAAIYQLTAALPATERLGISANLQQSAVQVPSLIARGTKRGRSGLLRACIEADSYCAEIETLLLIIQQAYPQVAVDDLLAQVTDVQDSLARMVKRLSGTAPSPKTI